MDAPKNASLLLTKFTRTPPTMFNTQANLPIWTRATACLPSDGYRRAYERWRSRIEEVSGTTISATFEVDGRMVTGIGAQNILESSVAMNRLWGMPVIPGSALKGLASHYTAQEMGGDVSPEQRVDLFGTTEWAGCIDWLDAWYVPPAAGSPEHGHSPFTLDVVTVHHQSYYGNPGSNPPWDFEDPIPSNFISVRGTFLVALRAPDEAWAQAAMKILRRALDEWGIGAKTNAGYGRLRFLGYQSGWVVEAEAKAKAEAEAALAAAMAEAELDLLAQEAEREHAQLLEELQDSTVQANLQAGHWAGVWSKLPDEKKTDAGSLILERLRQRPSEYHRITGRVWGNYPKPPGAPKVYMKPLLDWMDVHAPHVSQP